MEEKQLTEAIVSHRLRMTLQGIYADYPSTEENRIALSVGTLSTAVTVFLGDVLNPTVEDAHVVIDVAQKLQVILNEEKQKILDKHKSN